MRSWIIYDLQYFLSFLLPLFFFFIRLLRCIFRFHICRAFNCKTFNRIIDHLYLIIIIPWSALFHWLALIGEFISWAINWFVFYHLCFSYFKKALLNLLMTDGIVELRCWWFIHIYNLHLNLTEFLPVFWNFISFWFIIYILTWINIYGFNYLILIASVVS